MNKLFWVILLSFAGLCGFMVHAQDEAAEETLASIPAVLKDAKLVNKAKPNLKAKIYFVYQSRSTCGICVREAPILVKEYKKMKRKGCEMVMLNLDASPEKAADWVKRSKMEFPVISPAISMRCGMPWDYTGRPLLPCMVAMTPDGRKLGEASGPDVSEFVKDWKKLLNELRKEEAKERAAAKRAKKKSADAEEE